MCVMWGLGEGGHVCNVGVGGGGHVCNVGVGGRRACV